MNSTKDGCSNVASDFKLTRTSAIFSKLDMPPTSNNMYFLARRGAKTFHIPSDELKKFKTSILQYKYTQPQEYLTNLKLVQSWVNAGKALEVRCLFFFKRIRLLTKDNRPKKIDVSNRIKALHDSVSELMQIDDCYFFRISAEKVISLTDQEMCYVEILPIV